MKLIVWILLTASPLAVSTTCLADSEKTDFQSQLDRFSRGLSVSMTGLECTANVTSMITGGIEAERVMAEAGVDGAQFQLGRRYRFGIGVPRDIGRARELLEDAASVGNAEALLLLGNLLAHDGYKDYNPEKARSYYTDAARAGCPEGYVGLANLEMLKGKYDNGREYLEKGAKNGSQRAEVRLVFPDKSKPVTDEDRYRSIAQLEELHKRGNKLAAPSIFAKYLELSHFSKSDVRNLERYMRVSRNNVEFFPGSYLEVYGVLKTLYAGALARGRFGVGAPELRAAVPHLFDAACLYDVWALVSYGTILSRGEGLASDPVLAAAWLTFAEQDELSPKQIRAIARNLISENSKKMTKEQARAWEDYPRITKSFIFDQCEGDIKHDE